MKLPKPSHDFDLCPAGNHLGTCCEVLDIGSHETSFKGRSVTQRKVLIKWQIPAERTPDDEPQTVTKRYTLSSSERSNLRQDLESWRGKRFTDADFEGPDAFDLSSVLGKACCVSVVHNERSGNVYADVTNVTSLPKGTPRPKLEGHTRYLSLDPEAFDQAVFDSLSPKLRELIMATPEYRDLETTTDRFEQDATARTSDSDGAHDDIPF